MKIVIKQEDITRRNKEFGMLRSTGALRTRKVRDKSKYTRKSKHKSKGWG
jgi:hypothetical protein